MVRLLNKSFAMFLAGAVLSSMSAAADIGQLLQQATPEQKAMLQQATPEQKAALLGKAEQSSSAPEKVGEPVRNPETVKRTAVGAGRLAQEEATPSVDEKKTDGEIAASPKVDEPVDQLRGQASADRMEARRAFQDYVRESKPMVVNTQGLKQFGYDLFAGEPSTFAPATDVPVPPEYVLGPGDEIKVQLYGKTGKDMVLTVDREGAVALPDIGPLTLAGLSFAEAKAMIADEISKRMIGVSPSITMGQLRSMRVFALGDVSRPGSYTVSGLATLSHALFVSGGVKSVGSLRNIELKRNGRLVVTMDLYDFLLRGDTSRDVRLQAGDVVFAPPIGTTVTIAGEVIRPAIYELKKEKTLGEVVKLAGGLMPKAYADQALIERIDPRGETQVINVALTGESLNTQVRNGDVIKIFAGSEFEKNQVLLLGNLKRPGKRAWEEGMRISSLLTSLDDLLPETFLDYGVIEREAEDTREPMLMRFNLARVLGVGGKGGEFDIALRPRDRVYVFHRQNFRQQPVVNIAGSVKTPGQYEFKRNMKLADLVLAAGGVVRETDMEAVDVYRTDPRTHEVRHQQANLASAMAGDSANDVLLQDLDRVVVHSIFERKEREMVAVEGEVHAPGKVALFEGMRISDLVAAGNNITDKAYLKSAELTRFKVENGRMRVSEHIAVALESALSGMPEANLLLQKDDVLTIRRIYERTTVDQVMIEGEVHTPGTFNLTSGMRVSDLVIAGNDVTEKSYMKKAEITRRKVENGEMRVLSHIEVDLAAALRREVDADLLLQPYDILTVRRISGWREFESVSVDGEVAHPGRYQIEEGERLSTFLQRVGGYTKDAYLPAAVFTRESVRVEQQEQLNKLVKRLESELSLKQDSVNSLRDETLRLHQTQALQTATQMVAQLKSSAALGRMEIALSDIEQLKESPYDIRLRAGDRLVIPKRPDTVLVVGEVYTQSASLYNPDSDIEDYVTQAGLTRFADKSGIYVVRANGRVETTGRWMGMLDDIGPGDTIVVPTDLDHVNMLDIALDWSRALMQVGTSAAALKAIGVFK